jgi:hypothetical protein
MQPLTKVFELKRGGFSLSKGVELVVIMVLPLIVLEVASAPQYWLTVAFAILFTALSDPGNDVPYAVRARSFACVLLIGALVTTVAFGVGADNWIAVVIVAFVATLLSGFAAAYGKHAALVGYFLMVWFLIALSLPHDYAAVPWPATAWSQALAWLAGSVLWFGLTFLLSLRHSGPKPSHEEPAEADAPGWSQGLVAFSVLRALAIALAVAVAWGFTLPHADWMPVAALVVMKPDLGESVLMAEQRVAGAILGALVAAALLTLVHDRLVLAVVILLAGALAGAMRYVNYAIYCALVATTVLIGLGSGTPGNLTDNWERVGWTLVGVVIGLGVMLLAASVRKERTPATSVA